MVALTDRTINEAMRLGAEVSKINSMAELLKKYPMKIIDVDLCYLERDNIDLKKFLLASMFRCRIKGLKVEAVKAKKRGISKVVITWYHTPKSSNLKKLINALAETEKFADEIYLCIENAALFSVDELSMYWPILNNYGIKRLIYSDKEGVIDCFQLYNNLKELQQQINIGLEFIGYNTRGLASANSLSAIKAGTEYIATSAAGIGLPGVAAMEEVLMIMKNLCGLYPEKFEGMLAEDCSRILSYINIDVPVDKAIIGRNVFAHESGIHVDGVIKNPSLYEVIRPEDVGLKRQLIIGKHSGTASLKVKFLQWNLVLSQAQVVNILEKVREIAVMQKSPLTDMQLQQLYLDAM